MSFLSSLFGFGKPKSNAIKLLMPEEFKLQVGKGNVQLIDVRTPANLKKDILKVLRT